MSSAGWYPDPGGSPGKYRWWDGQQWTPSLTANPASPPPIHPDLPMQAAQPSPYAAATVETPRRGRAVATVIIAGVVFIALVAGAIWAINRISGGIFGGGPAPVNPTTDVCPNEPSITESPLTPTAQPAGRVRGGQLSYPQLGEPWGAPTEETRVPFGRDVIGQDVMLHPNFDGQMSWVASVDVGELVAGDGFFSPEQGAEIVTRCVIGVFYGNAEVSRTDVVNRATTVDGYDAWEVEMHLGFSIPGLDETGETAIIVIVSTSLESSSIFYASIPDSRPDLLETARQVQGQLQVED